MNISFRYVFRNVWRRKMTAALTFCGFALVVFVFAATLMLANGVETSMVATGSSENLFVEGGRGALTRETVSLLKTLPGVAVSPDGTPLAVAESIETVALKKKKDGKVGNIEMRGTEPGVLSLRSDVRIIKGRMFSPGTFEVVVGRSAERYFEGTSVGSTLGFAGQTWTVVGVFDAGGSAFDSEVWAHAEQTMPVFGRRAYSQYAARMNDPAAFESVAAGIAADPRFEQLKARREDRYYAERSEDLTTFIRSLGLMLTGAFLFAALIGGMITMYAYVADRTREIGTLRALGFRRRAILGTFLLEAVSLSLIGCALGLLAALGMQVSGVAVMGWGVHNQSAFGFVLSTPILLYTVLFAVMLGGLGGLFPAVRAARMNIVSALKGE